MLLHDLYFSPVLQEKSFGQMQYRAILWTKDGPKRLQFCGNGKSVTIKNVSRETEVMFGFQLINIAAFDKFRVH